MGPDVAAPPRPDAAAVRRASGAERSRVSEPGSRVPASDQPSTADRDIARSPGSGALREWQRRAVARYLASKPRDFLAAATPGAGKTTFGLRVAAELLADRTVTAVTVVTPTEHLKYQWAQAASRVGIALDPEFRNTSGATSRDYHGAVLTYAQVAAHPVLHRARTDARRTLVILDEVHHAGDAKSWGDAIREAFEPATRRVALTGTPFRSDDNPIPFVTYQPDRDGVPHSKADHSYGYADALRDGVVRPVVFLAYSGQASWRTSAGEEFTARLGEPMTAEQTARAWRTALDPNGEWISSVLAAADTRLTQLRAGGMPDAGALLIASDQTAARAYAALLHRLTGTAPVLVLSDEAGASDRIAAFAASQDRWLVAVRMVSEGVDVPRLAVGVYATSASTPLFFAQAVGRFVRARRPGETASVFLPSVPALLELASALERQRDHVLGKPDRPKEGWDDELLADANRVKDEPGEEEKAFVALGADAELDQVIYDGASFGTAALAGSEEEQDYLGLPGLLEPEQVRALLLRRQTEQLAARATSGGEQLAARAGSGASGGSLDASAAPKPRSEPPPPAPRRQSVHERLSGLRRELNTLVALTHHRTGKPHGLIHGELRRLCGGPPTAMATIEQLEQRIATLRSWR
jgi:superfamily II DNA or RNA helicase